MSYDHEDFLRTLNEGTPINWQEQNSWPTHSHVIARNHNQPERLYQNYRPANQAGSGNIVRTEREAVTSQTGTKLHDRNEGRNETRYSPVSPTMHQMTYPIPSMQVQPNQTQILQQLYDIPQSQQPQQPKNSPTHQPTYENQFASTPPAENQSSN